MIPQSCLMKVTIIVLVFHAINEALQTSLTQEKGPQVVDTLMTETGNYGKAYVSCSRNETGSIVKTIELNEATSIDTTLMEAMNHNRMRGSSSINGVEQSVEK